MNPVIIVTIEVNLELVWTLPLGDENLLNLMAFRLGCPHATQNINCTLKAWFLSEN
jgi:hypothetical protein